MRQNDAVLFPNGTQWVIKHLSLAGTGVDFETLITQTICQFANET
jgi:hypothetical protein